MPGLMAQVNTENRALGFLSFLRLVGAVYFKKHLVSFTTVCNVETPQQLYNSTDSACTPEDRHKLFIQKICSINSERITSEDERMPSLSSLWRHWLRTTYTCTLWQNSHLHDAYSNLPLPENSGWMVQEDGSYIIDWDDPNEMHLIKKNINHLLSGCKCKKGCATNRCGCKQKSIHCGPGCQCSGCKNLPHQIDQIENESESSNDSSSSDADADELETEIITQDDDNFISTMDIL